VSIAWLSDCHLDRAAPHAIDHFHATLRSAAPQAVIVTGDLSNASRLVADLMALADAAGATIYHVLGNHDYYGSSIGNVRDAVLALAAQRPDIQWLPPAGPVRLNDATLLVGVDGWADGRYGEPLRTPLVLNDDRLIAEVAAQEGRAAKLLVKRILADADARRLGTLLERAADEAPTRIVVATHVPPFIEALAPGSRESHPDWHPLLVSRATGDVLRAFALAHPDIELDVLAGHSHRACEAHITPNLRVRVAAARYGAPQVAIAAARPPSDTSGSPPEDRI
jgi:predicted phosphohydrolase